MAGVMDPKVIRLVDLLILYLSNRDLPNIGNLTQILTLMKYELARWNTPTHQF